MEGSTTHRASIQAGVSKPPLLAGSGAADSCPDEPARTLTRKRDALEQELLALWGHINAATYRFLALVAEFDRNEYWGGVGILSCAHWLNVYCGIGTGAAREKIRVARALESLPLISRAFERGEISYSKVRAMTRVATPDTESTLLEIARYGTASQLERLVGHCRSVERREESEQAEQRVVELESRSGRRVSAETREDREGDRSAARASDRAAKRCDHRTGDTPETDVSAETSPARATAQGTQAAREPIVEEQPLDRFGACRADALLRLAEHFLDSDSKNSPSSAERYQVVVHIDQTLLASHAVATSSVSSNRKRAIRSMSGARPVRFRQQSCGR